MTSPIITGFWRNSFRRPRLSGDPLIEDCKPGLQASRARRLKLRRVTSFCAASIAGFAKRSLDPDCAVVSGGLRVSPASPMPGARIRSPRPGRDRRRHARRRSNGSTPRWATSRPPSQEPAIRSGCDDPTAHMGRRPNHADALSAPEIG